MSDRFNGNPREDSVEDRDARLEELTSAIHEALSASASRSQKPSSLNSLFRPQILANIREKNRLSRLWHTDRDPASKNGINCLQR